MRRILVIGGGGFYGRYLVNDLVRFTQANLIVAGRKPSPIKWMEANRIQFVQCDIAEIEMLEQVADECNVIVHCAGPFQLLPLNPLRAAIHKKIDYVDIAEDRDYHKEVRKLDNSIQNSGISVLSGMSVAPAMEILFTDLMRCCFDTLLSVRTFAAPDTRKHRGKAMFYTMLLGVGRPFRQPGPSGPREVWGWTEPEWVEFPPPLGMRLTYLVLEMADLDLLPELFGIQIVEFKAGTEWAILNRLLGTAAGIRKAIGYPGWEKLMPIVRMFSWVMGRFGKDEGGVIFEMKGVVKHSMITRRIAIVARRDGGLIPSVLASLGTKKLLDDDLQSTGIIPLNKWISSEELIMELSERGLEIWWKPQDSEQWRLFDFVDYRQYVID